MMFASNISKNFKFSFSPNVLMFSWFDSFILSIVSLSPFSLSADGTFFNVKFRSYNLAVYS